jgi:tetratricopeptide (TPR) repeat protein
MPPKPARRQTLIETKSRTGGAAKPPRRGSRSANRKGQWLRPAIIAGGLVAAGLLSAFAWSEYHPAALALAEAAYQRNNLAAALDIALGHLERRPFSRSAAVVAARCLSRLGQPDRAEPYYKRAGSLDPEDRHIRAYALVLNNRRESAIRAYQELLERRPDDVLALSRMAAVLISERRWDDALKASDHLIRIPAGAVIGHSLAGVVHHNMREWEQAVADFGRVLALDPQLKQMPLKPRSMFWADLGANLLMMGRAEEARQQLRRAIGEGNDAKIADLLGHACYLEGDFDEAENYWRLALQCDPNRFGTWWRIGKLELQRGRLEEAVEPLRRSSELEPNAVGPLYSLSLVFRRLGRNQDADQLKERADRIRRGRSSEPREHEDDSALGGESIDR